MDSLYPNNVSAEDATKHAAQAISDSVKMWRGIEGMQEQDWSTFTIESFAVDVALDGLEAFYKLLVARGAEAQAIAAKRVLGEVSMKLDKIRKIDLETGDN